VLPRDYNTSVIAPKHSLPKPALIPLLEEQELPGGLKTIQL